MRTHDQGGNHAHMRIALLTPSNPVVPGAMMPFLSHRAGQVKRNTWWMVVELSLALGPALRSAWPSIPIVLEPRGIPSPHA